ncbi:hypothetical protein BGW80DRAFT_421801 [Lactifluus volemus]|nr:hypothetical protein BGW80DRAFT_421801 [Lactifluus volemus]
MASTAPIDSLFPQQTRGSKPFSTLTLKRIRISPYMVSFRKFSVVAQAAYHAPRFPRSRCGSAKVVYHLEEERTIRGRFFAPAFGSYHRPRLTPITISLVHWLAIMRSAHLPAPTTSGFCRRAVSLHIATLALVERMWFQNGALEALLALLEMTRRLRGEALQLKILFKTGTCRQFKCIVKEGTFYL